MIQINTNFIPNPSGVYIVGGTVRDLLLGIAPQDYDIVTIHDPEELARGIAASAGGRPVKLGKPGLTSYRVVSPQRIYDISSAKEGSIERDLLRRDFTINALAVDAETGELIDKVNGISDISQKKIRMIHPRNLVDDPLRMLRAYRLAALFDFSLDPDTAEAISAEAFRIGQSAGERIRDELMKLLQTSRAYHWLLEMDRTGLLREILPEMEKLKGCMQNKYHRFDVFDHTLNAFAVLERLMHDPVESGRNRQAAWPSFVTGRTALLKLALLLHDTGKPDCRSTDPAGGIHFYGHELKSAEISAAITSRLRFSACDQSYVYRIIRHHLQPLFLFTARQKQRLSKKAVTRFFMRLDPHVPDVLLHAVADTSAKGTEAMDGGFIAFAGDLLDEYRGSFKTRAARPPLISGHDLIRIFHLAPSPDFSRILSRVETERLSGNITSRKDALDYVQKFLESYNPS